MTAQKPTAPVTQPSRKTFDEIVREIEEIRNDARKFAVLSAQHSAATAKQVEEAVEVVKAAVGA